MGGPRPGMAPADPTTVDAGPTERRIVTVLFADLVGFTALSDDRDPEAVREFLDGYFALARERIGRYGGTIEKFIGDAVMAVWGTPGDPRGRRRARRSGGARSRRRGGRAAHPGRRHRRRRAARS